MLMAIRDFFHYVDGDSFFNYVDGDVTMLMAIRDFVNYVDGDVAMLMAIRFLTMKMAIRDFVHYVDGDVTMLMAMLQKRRMLLAYLWANSSDVAKTSNGAAFLVNFLPFSNSELF